MGPSQDQDEKDFFLHISRALNGPVAMDDLLAEVVDVAMSMTAAEAGTLWLVEGRGEARPVVARGEGATALTDMRLFPGEGLVGRVIARNEPEIFTDVRNYIDWARRFDQATGFVTRSLMCIPLRGHNTVVGCLQLVNKRYEPHFTQTDLDSALAFAGHAAIALENRRLREWQDQLLNSLIGSLASALDARDPYTHGHTQRVSSYAQMIGETLGIEPVAMQELQRAALLHDIGKIGISDALLQQDGVIDEETWQTIKEHPNIGARILDEVAPKHLVARIREAVLHHHEHFDGSGYPMGLKGQAIPLFARIIAIADAYDAITTSRPYRTGAESCTGINELERCAHSQFDPRILDLFIDALRKRSNEHREMH
ncbi:MAG: HD domain-containing phosphohydrolase [Thermaerobacterales bacterium]